MEIIERQRRFFAGNTPGERLVFVWGADPQPDAPAVEQLPPQVNAYYLANDGQLPDHAALEAMVRKTVADCRRYWRWRDELVDDDLPHIVAVHFDIGIQTAVMTGIEPRLEGSWWLDCNLTWDRIDALPATPDNRWFEMFRSLNQLLWEAWDGDFHFLPFWHRSPLDAANGIRGNELFLEMYTAPDRVKALTDWCVDCELAIENSLAQTIQAPDDWGVGHMGFVMPPGGVWVNGDPVALISREMMLEFEQPYTGRLFTSTGGGFFHNHTKGLYQVDQVAKTPGICLQHFNADPNCPRVSDILAGPPAARDNLLAASRQTPIFPDQILYDELDAYRPHLNQGRFALDITCPADKIDSVINEFKP
ncbi:hypothetical protein LCGC14_0449990 [marine sediment metagenome]|uniref:Uroporphyrinogen decarboxylase (URO-D) domain-containing protein n=1 Tax=marine sediment metagenome TaxID=412755 RepID=A0A0F9VS25_9ZZZZ